MISDDRDFVALGYSIASGQGFILEGRPSAYRLPAYPVLLAASFKVFGDSLLPAQLLQMLCDLGSCILLYFIGRRLFSESAGLVASGVFLLFPMQILYVPLLMSETVYTFLLLLIVWLIVSTEVSELSLMRLVLLGILIGVGILFRSITLMLPLVVFVYGMMSHVKLTKNLRAVGTLSIIACLVVLPWMIRNYEEFGRFSLTSNAGVNFWIGNHPGASGSYSFPVHDNPLQSIGDDFVRSDVGFQDARKFIASAPLQWLGIVAKKYAHFVGMDYWLMELLQYQPRWATYTRAADVFREYSWWSYVLINFPVALILLSAAFAFVMAPAFQAGRLRFLLLLTVVWLAVHLVVFAGARFRFPIQPLLILAGVVGVQIFVQRSFVVSRFRVAILTIIFISLIGSWGAAFWMMR